MGRPKKEKRSNSINMNMLRERALRLPDVTDEMYFKCNIDNRNLIEEYLEVSSHLSPESRKQYVSCLRQFCYWIFTACNDKNWNKISKRDFMRYMSYLTNRGMSSSTLKLKKSAVSAMNEYICNVVSEDDFDNFGSFRNFTKGLPPIPKNQVYNKIAISEDEYSLMIKTLLEDENYLGVAWVATMFNVGCRRNGCIQFKSEIANYPKEAGQDFIMSHIVMEKGRAGGKPVQYMINDEAMKYIKLWLEKRGYEHEYIFTVKYAGQIKKMSKEWADEFCSDVLSDIVGRRINVHLFKASCVTQLLSNGVDIKLVSKYVAQHEDISTTQVYDLRTFEKEKKSIFANMPKANISIDLEDSEEDTEN